MCLLRSVFIFCLFTINHIRGTSLRVVGGYEAPSEFSKYTVSLQNLDGEHVCGGSVVSLRHIVTAAHCVNGALPEYIKAFVGTVNLHKGGQHYDISQIKMHEKFDFVLRLHDIAILTIKGSFDLKSVEIIKMHKEILHEGEAVILTGFGAQEAYGETSTQLFLLDQTVFNQETCKYAMRYTREVFDEMFCTFTTIGEGTCHGDSGGPLVKDNELVGIVSWGIPCAVGFPDVHTRISPYIEWIENEISKPQLPSCSSYLRKL